MTTWHRPDMVRTNHAQFELIHVEPSDIELVAVSHTHPDHAGNIEMFANAAFAPFTRGWAARTSIFTVKAMLSYSLAEDLENTIMSHHYSGPNVGFPRGDARLDLTDLYAFPKPGDPAKSIFIMNFHPSVGLQPQAPTTSEPFAPDARYELRIDTDGDAVANITYQVRLSSLPGPGGKQSATLRRFEGAQAESGGNVISDAMPVSTGREAHSTQASDHRFFAGWRSDPFFFDVLGVLNNFQFTTGDFFSDKDICSIVLEVPNSQLGPKAIGIWARTLIPADGAGSWVQADRGARPNQTPFLSGDHNDAYLAAEPADDARFVPVFAHSLEHTGGYTPEAAKQVAAKLLPDILHYDPKRPARFPDNGRALNDDVSDIFLGILTNGKVTGDKVGPHNDLLAEFPYLGPPHTIRDK